MLGIIVIIVLSWLVLWLATKEHLWVLGILPTRLRLRLFVLGFLLTAIVCCIHLLGQAYFQNLTYILNPDYALTDALHGIWWTVKSVLFEELIFRGVLLYLLIRKIGVIKACIADALCFGIYHWFSYDMLGGALVPLIYVLLLTGAAGWMFAYAYAKTKSLFAPFGLHLGWNFVTIVVLSSGPLGNQWFILSGESVPLDGWATLLFFLWQTVVAPGIATWYLNKHTAPSQTTNGTSSNQS